MNKDGTKVLEASTVTELKSLKRLHIDGTKIFKKGSTVIKLKSLERSHSDGAKKF